MNILLWTADVIFSILLLKLFGVNSIYCLALVCMLTYLRNSLKTDRFYKLCECVLYTFAEEEDEENKIL